MSNASLKDSKTLAKEKLIGRVLFPREGMAGSAKMWECFFVDADNPKSVALMEAWGAKNIGKAQDHLKAGKVHKITKFLVEPNWKSIPLANQTTKNPITPSIEFEELKEADHSHIPNKLPIENLKNIVELQASRVVSLIVKIHEPKVHQVRELKAGRGQKPVTNVVVKAEGRKIDFVAWGPLVERISGKDALSGSTPFQ